MRHARVRRGMNDPLARPVDAVAGRTGLTRDAVAILFIVAGVLVIFFEPLLRIVLGVLLIVVGIVWLVNSRQQRAPAATAPPAPPESPPPP